MLSSFVVVFVSLVLLMLGLFFRNSGCCMCNVRNRVVVSLWLVK